MTKFDPQQLAMAFVSPNTPTLADTLRHVETASDLTPTRRRDLISSRRRLAKAIGWPLDQAPANALWLRPRIAAVAPAAAGLSPKSWSNVISDVRAALARTGSVGGKPPRPVPLSGEWTSLWAQLLALQNPSLPPALGRFVRFLSRLGVAPSDVSASVHG